MDISNLENLYFVYRDVKNSASGTIGKHERFVVSITDNAVNFKGLTFKKFKSILSDLNNTAQKLNIGNSYCLGYWYDIKAGVKKLYIDLNLSTNNEITARAVAEVFKQKAIYDSHKKRVINLGV